jgi:A/G-specific adenine glycosylase
MDISYPKGFYIKWYKEHGRLFPWRAPGVSPYGILVAEMMLRQTLAEMVVPIWQAFISKYPYPSLCAVADSNILYQLLAPLGLGQQRVTSLQSVSTELLNRYNGEIPQSISALLELPHVGLYTAHAVMCFAYGQRVPVVDANVIRVFSRLTGTAFLSDNRRAKVVWELATQILPAKRVREHNYGLLDFAAQVCTSRKPACSVCLLAKRCYFSKNKNIWRLAK